MLSFINVFLRFQGFAWRVALYCWGICTLVSFRYAVRELSGQKQKYLVLRFLSVIAAFFSADFFVETLVEQQLVPESFALECLIFSGLWLALDCLFSLGSKVTPIGKILFLKRVFPKQLFCFAISLGIATLFFKFYSFPL
jgi:hypothetical protein